MTAIAIEGVAVRIDGRDLLAGISGHLATGEWLGLIGPNGAGKTTLIRVLSGVLVPTTGRVTLGGRDLGGMARSEVGRHIAVVPQRPVLPADMRVIDYVLLGRSPYISHFGVERQADVEVVVQTLGDLDLDGLEGRRLGRLSGGEQQRVVLARALAQRAQVLLLDEPTTALDVGHQQQVLDLIDRLHRRMGITIVSSLHDLTLAGQYCERLMFLSGGSVVGEGRAAEVLTGPALSRHYGASVRVIDDGRGGAVVIPVRDSTDSVARGTMDTDERIDGATLADG